MVLDGLYDLKVVIGEYDEVLRYFDEAIFIIKVFCSVDYYLFLLISKVVILYKMCWFEEGIVVIDIVIELLESIGGSCFDVCLLMSKVIFLVEINRNEVVREVLGEVDVLLRKGRN